MTRKFVKLAVCAGLAILTGSADVFAGRGGGYGGGRGGGYGGGGNRGGMQGGGYSTSHSPSFSQPPSGAGYSNRNQSQNHNAGSAAAGAGYANRNQSQSHNAGSAAAGAGYANRNQSQSHNAGSAAAGAGYANRNQSQNHNAGSAAAGAGYANRNQSQYSNAGAAAAGAGYANRNQSQYPNAGAAAAGAAYANNNPYNQYHAGMTNGYWNGNYGAWGMGSGGYGGVGAWGVGSPMYGYGYSAYSNPYSAGMTGAGAGQAVAPGQPAGNAAFDYSQPLNTAATPAPAAPADQATTAFNQARDAFRTNDYATALASTQQALAQVPNDPTMHEFLGLVFFAQGKYEQAAAPLYSVLSVGPGWDWTSLIGNYNDANVYTEQLRALETYVKANATSAPAQFVLAYHYITQGHGDAAVGPLKAAVALQPNDTLSAQLLAKLQPASVGSTAPPAAPQPQPFDAGKLTGDWVASAPQNAKVTLSIAGDGGFTWAVAAPGKPATSIKGTSAVADGVLTLTDKDSRNGALAGQVVWQDDSHFAFRAMGAPPDDPGLKFAR
jgi:Tetratricopeptide repeat